MNEQSEQLSRLRQHLQDVERDPSKSLDEKLLDTAMYSLIPTLEGSDRQSLVLSVYQLLPTLQQDPRPLVRLLTKLLEPIPLSAVLAIEPPIDFYPGLDIDTPPFNTLTLSLLEKADRTSAQNLASAYTGLFTLLVDLWLSTQDEGVADQAGRVLLHLLKIDLPDPGTIGRDGPVWRRFFSADVYARLFEITGGKTLDRSRTPIAQARLLDWLLAVGALDWNAISTSYHPELERKYGLKEGEGLLDYAMLHMVDYKRDVLMHRTLMAAYEALLKLNPYGSLTTSPSLTFLTKTGLHQRTINYYTSPDDPSHDPLDVSFLYAPAANYVATWTDTYPADFASSKNANLRAAILKKISAAVNVSAARWAHAHSPAEDLHVLSSLPRSTLLSLENDNPVLALPSRAANTDALNCLATIFHGQLAEILTFPPRQEGKANEDEELKAAQALYTQYLTHSDRMWSNIVTHADTVALAPQALAAINLVRAVLTAQWGGVDAIMEGPAKASVVPWLLSPPKTFSNLVGGHGDAENAAYKIATAKHDLLRVFHGKIKGEEKYADIAKVAEQRLRDGPWGAGGEIGGRIGTLEL